MRKIVWISSYPKSGNTWIRYFLCNYLFNKNCEESNFGILKHIDKFPPYEYMEKIVDKKILEVSAYNISKYWLKIQSELVKKNNNYILFKNQNALVSVEGNDLTNEIYSLGAIYIVRDPRDVIFSYVNYDHNLSITKAIKRLTSENLYCHVSKRYPLNVDILGSWKFHYISWRDGLNQIPKIIVRYEDLINDTFQTMLKIITFLSSLINCKIDHEKIKFSIKQSSFQRLQKLENKVGFYNYKNNFYNSGKINQWKGKLSIEQLELIENSFEKEMKELNYL